MKVKVPFTWKQAAATRFCADRIRREGRTYRSKRLSCLIDKSCEMTVRECRDWLKENEVTKYQMFGVFVNHPDKVYYSGLAFEFEDETQALFFKLRFF